MTISYIEHKNWTVMETITLNNLHSRCVDVETFVVD